VLSLLSLSVVSETPPGSDEDAGHRFPRSKATWSDWSRLNLDVCRVDAAWEPSGLIASLEGMMVDGAGYSANLTVLLMGFGGGVFTIGSSPHSLLMGDGFIARWASHRDVGAVNVADMLWKY
jgi:hypothetical protein